MDRHDPHTSMPESDGPDSDAMPEAGSAVTVAPGILWVRMPLPFALDHINIWLLEDDGDLKLTLNTQQLQAQRR